MTDQKTPPACPPGCVLVDLPAGPTPLLESIQQAFPDAYPLHTPPKPAERSATTKRKRDHHGD